MATAIFTIFCIAAECFLFFSLFHFIRDSRKTRFHHKKQIEKDMGRFAPLPLIGLASIDPPSLVAWNPFVCDRDYAAMLPVRKVPEQKRGNARPQ